MMKQEFDQSILQQLSHRPYPLPEGPWIMRQIWSHLLFAHWPIPKAKLRALVPPELPLDTFADTAWLGIVPFRMSDVSVRNAPALPWLSEFPELNVRTYVTLDGRPGVYFFSLDAGNPVAVGVARVAAGLPYHTAAMDVVVTGETVHYRSRRRTGRPPAEFVGTYHPCGMAQAPRPGSLEHWLTERYCLYTVNDGDVYRLDIHHPPWPLQPAAVTIAVNSMTAPLGLTLPDTRPLAHFARRQDMVAWAPVKR
jgi:uncharacterized protein